MNFSKRNKSAEGGRIKKTVMRRGRAEVAGTINIFISELTNILDDIYHEKKGVMT